MSLPRHVQDQIDRANQVQQELNAPVETPTNPVDETALTGKPVVEPIEKPAAQPAEQTPATDLLDGKPASYWKHRFDVLQGKYNAEVPALRKDLTEMQKQIKTAAIPDGTAVNRAQTAVSDLTPEEIEEFGPELVDMIRRVAGNVAMQSQPQQPDGMQEMLDRMKAQDEDRRQDVEATFWSRLEQAVPRFREINSDPAFHAYLSEVEPLSGSTRQNLLLSAQEDLNAARVIAVFNNFGTPKQQPAARQIPGELIAPRSTGGGGGETWPKDEGKIWTPAAITQFYREKTDGRITGDQAKQTEADIFAAQNEGRVRHDPKGR